MHRIHFIHRRVSVNLCSLCSDYTQYRLAPALYLEINLALILGFDFSMSHLTATADHRSHTGETKYLRTSFSMSHPNCLRLSPTNSCFAT
jgi:hypothetical protein